MKKIIITKVLTIKINVGIKITVKKVMIKKDYTH